MKSHIFHISILFGSVALLSLIGCNADDFGMPSQKATADIRFTTSLHDGGTTDTRGRSLDFPDYEGVLPMSVSNSTDSMYLHSEVLDWTASDTDMESMTRSNLVTSQNGMYSQFNVSAYHYTDDWTASKAKYKPNYFYFTSASGDMGSGYSMDSQRYWPNEGKMRFLAFAPFSTWNTGDFIMGNVDSISGPYVHIEANADVSQHRDLLVAYSEEVECSGARAPQNLNFKHALSCIQFVMASDMDTIRVKSIEIDNVKYRGDMRFADNMADKDASSSADASLNSSYYAWDGYRNFKLNLADSDNPNGKQVKGGDVITDDTHSFLMFPQALPDTSAAKVTITLSRLKNGSWGADESMFGYLNGKKWPAGKIVRYRLSNNSWWQELQVSTLPAFPPTGGDHYFSITSYDLASDGTRTPIKWTAQYEDPNNPGTFIDTKPTWFDFDTVNNGAINPASIKVTAQATSDYHPVDLEAALKNASPASYGTQSNPYNLSTNTTGTSAIGTTANCYIVDRPGWYILPLVYGNGIVSGSDNKNAYDPGTDTANGAISGFVNNLGQTISSPYILTDCASQASSVTSSSAGIVWQDHANLIRNTSISVDKSAFGGKGGILFEVAAGDITQGNSVIGLKVPGSTDEMMWSWHIWVTPFFRDGLDPIITETIGITNYDGTPFDMLFTPLGWRSEDPLKVYPPRSSKVKFTAVTSDGRTLSKILNVEQAPFVSFWHGSNTYYQWGRKDPFMPFVKSYNQTWYDADGNFRYQYPNAEKFGNGATALQKRIQNPSVFHITDETKDASGAVVPANLSVYTNLWNATFSLAPTVNKYDPTAIEPIKIPSHNNVKSVYDPCPPGFKVPPVHTFTGFTSTGNNIGQITENPKNWNGTLMEYTYECGGETGYEINTPSVYLFYTNPEKTAYIAFPLTGYRDWRSGDGVTSGSGIQMGDYGYSWTAGVASSNQAYYLELMRNDPKVTTSTGWVQPLDYFWQVDALPVRPCKDN